MKVLCGVIKKMEKINGGLKKESQGLKDVTQYVLNLGWDSSSYGLFMRALQYHIRKN